MDMITKLSIAEGLIDVYKTLSYCKELDIITILSIAEESSDISLSIAYIY